MFISSSYFLKKLSLNTDFFSLLLSDLCQVWGTSPWVLSQGYPRPSTSNNTSYYHCCWLPLLVKSYTWSMTHVGHRTWRNQIRTDKEASSLLASSHCTRRCYTDCWGVIRNSFSQMWAPWTAIMTCVAREMLWGQPTPFCLDLRPKHKKKHMPDTVNLTKIPCLVAYSLCGSAYYYYFAKWTYTQTSP